MEICKSAKIVPTPFSWILNKGGIREELDQYIFVSGNDGFLKIDQAR